MMSCASTTKPSHRQPCSNPSMHRMAASTDDCMTATALSREALSSWSGSITAQEDEAVVVGEKSDGSGESSHMLRSVSSSTESTVPRIGDPAMVDPSAGEPGMVDPGVGEPGMVDPSEDGTLGRICELGMVGGTMVDRGRCGETREASVTQRPGDGMLGVSDDGPGDVSGCGLGGACGDGVCGDDPWQCKTASD